MTQKQFFWALAIFLVAIIAQCGSSAPIPVAPVSDIVDLTPDQREKFATLINLNGLLCARVIEARAREEKTYYVDCETYRGQSVRRAYTVDLKTGKAQ